MGRWRVLLAVAGILLIGLGAVRILVGVPIGEVAVLILWLIGAVVLHDGIIAPVTIGVGALLGRWVPDRARHYLQAFLVAAGLVTVIAIPLISRRNTQPASKAILQQNYVANLTILLGLIAAASLLCYALAVARDSRRNAVPAKA